jgi:hypothetical protein
VNFVGLGICLGIDILHISCGTFLSGANEGFALEMGHFILDLSSRYGVLGNLIGKHWLVHDFKRLDSNVANVNAVSFHIVIVQLVEKLIVPSFEKRGTRGFGGRWRCGPVLFRRLKDNESSIAIRAHTDFLGLPLHNQNQKCCENSKEELTTSSQGECFIPAQSRSKQ